MEDFIELGFEAVYKAVDKGLHKLPDGAFPKPFRPKRNNSSRPNPSSPPRSSRDLRSPDYDVTQPQPSHRRRDDDPENTRKSYPNSSKALDMDRDRDYDDRRNSTRQHDHDYDRDRERSPGDDGYSNAGRDREQSQYTYSPYYTPKTGMLAYQDPYQTSYEDTSGSRRSRSQHLDDRRPEAQQRASSLSGGGGDRDRDRGRDVGERVKGAFSNSDKGLGAGVVGALAGGLLAQEAGLRKGKDGRGVKDPILLTLLGAAIGGLGANALEKKWEEKKRGEEGRRGGRERSVERSGRKRSGESSGRNKSDEGGYESDEYDEYESRDRKERRDSGRYDDRQDRRDRRSEW